MSDMAAIHQGRIIDACERVNELEEELAGALKARDKVMRAAHPLLSYNKIVAATDPEQNGGHLTKRLSRGRVIQIIQPKGKKK